MGLLLPVPHHVSDQPFLDICTGYECRTGPDHVGLENETDISGHFQTEVEKLHGDLEIQRTRKIKQRRVRLPD